MVTFTIPEGEYNVTTNSALRSYAAPQGRTDWGLRNEEISLYKKSRNGVSKHPSQKSIEAAA